MIEYISGKLAELTPTEAIIETGGIGYQLFISLNTYTAIQGKKEVKLYVNEVIREDTHQLYGFADKKERTLFLLLNTVPSIGNQTARMILSAFSPTELVGIIRDENARLLKSVKGIGPKGAQRIIIDLKDKIPADFGFDSSASGADAGKQGAASMSVNKETIEEAVSALVMLGFQPGPTNKAVLQIVRENNGITVEQVIKMALKIL